MCCFMKLRNVILRHLDSMNSSTGDEEFTDELSSFGFGNSDKYSGFGNDNVEDSLESNESELSPNDEDGDCGFNNKNPSAVASQNINMLQHWDLVDRSLSLPPHQTVSLFIFEFANIAYHFLYSQMMAQPLVSHLTVYVSL